MVYGILRLSDAFINPDKSGDFEWTAVLYNLNRGKNDELRIKCDALNGYMILVEKIRENLKLTSDVAKAVDTAVVSCINKDILKEFLLAHRSEVVDMVLTEYDEKTFVNGIKEEGRDSERRELIAKLLKRGKTLEEISDLCGYPMELIMEVKNSLTD